MLNKINDVYKLYVVGTIIEIILFLLMTVKFVVQSSAILLLFNTVIFFLCIAMGRYYGWNKYVYDFLYSQCNISEYGRFMFSRIKNKNKVPLDLANNIAFLTGQKEYLFDQEIGEYIDIEDKMWLCGNKDDVKADEINLLIEKSTNSCGFVEQYLPIIKDTVMQNYSDALQKLYGLASDNAYNDIPRRFYSTIIRLKTGENIDNLKNDIIFILNKGKDTRYSKYISSLVNCADLEIGYIHEKIYNKMLIPISLYIIWGFLVMALV